MSSNWVSPILSPQLNQLYEFFGFSDKYTPIIMRLQHIFYSANAGSILLLIQPNAA